MPQDIAGGIGADFFVLIKNHYNTIDTQSFFPANIDSGITGYIATIELATRNISLFSLINIRTIVPFYIYQNSSGLYAVCKGAIKHQPLSSRRTIQMPYPHFQANFLSQRGTLI
ncbi:hypothetical protein V5J34_002910 [Endozoicomonas sp. NE35]